MTTRQLDVPGPSEAKAAMAAAKYAQLPQFARLPDEIQKRIGGLAARYAMTVQEARILVEAEQDLAMWDGPSLSEWWRQNEAITRGRADKPAKKRMLSELRKYLDGLRAAENRYPSDGLQKPKLPVLQSQVEESSKNLMGLCPVASEETVCCNLRTIDVVENCGMACSYCTIQTFYGDKVTFQADLPQRLAALDLDPERFYHIGTGQSSDSLMWGNQHGVLDALVGFARARPTVLLEFKTKSKNVGYFLRNEIPDNVVLSWSLNPQTLIDNEEHRAASLEERLAAARSVADRGIRVSFHFHPIVHYDGWQDGYSHIAMRLLALFKAQEVSFVSLGTLTYIKPVLRAIRERGWRSDILKMPLVPGAKGKLTYPDDIKRALFSHVYGALAPWHDDVLFYLCMEEAKFWWSTFGRCFANNDDLEREFAKLLTQ